MQVTVCDKCQERVEGPLYVLTEFRFVLNGVVKFQIDHKEFCSLVCQNTYIRKELLEQGLIGETTI